MSDNEIHVLRGGVVQKPRPSTPKSIKAHSQARDSFTRLIIGGIVLALLAVAYLIVLWKKLDGAEGILPVIASSLGYLFANRERPTPDP